MRVTTDPNTMQISLHGKKYSRIFLLVFGMLLSLFADVGLAKGSVREGEKKPEYNRYISKGGIGIITQHLYIVTSSENNELILNDGRRWKGLRLSMPQVVLIWHDRIFDVGALPDELQLQESTVISFHPDHVDFADFPSGAHGYYPRVTESGSDGPNPYKDQP